MEKYNDESYFYETNFGNASPPHAFRYVKTDINPFNVSETVQFWQNHVTGEWQYRNSKPRTDSQTEGENDDLI